jgi:transcriptional regulator with XRE-family HTH domain
MPARKTDPSATIGGRIAQARFGLAAKLGSNVTQAWLAKQVGVSGPTVSQWESGVTEPTISSIAKIAKALSVSPGWLAWGESEGEQVPRSKEMSGFEAQSSKPAAKKGRLA